MGLFLLGWSGILANKRPRRWFAVVSSFLRTRSVGRSMYLGIYISISDQYRAAPMRLDQKKGDAFCSTTIMATNSSSDIFIISSLF